MSGSTRLRLAAKRGLDVVGATAGLLILSPLMAWVAVAELITQGPPIIFRQERPGLNEEPFTVLKFRTMRPPRSDEIWYATDADRVSRLGRFLRSSSID